MPELITLPAADAVAERAADLVLAAALQAVVERGRFLWVLAGGSTPEKLYRLLATGHYRENFPWAQTFVFAGDERFVDETDPAHNFMLARRVLLDHVPLPPANRYPIETYLPSAGDAAEEYGDRLADFFAGQPIVFDLVLLGLGDDGHTASLFPGKPELSETRFPVIASEPGVLPPPVERVSLSFIALNAARQVLFLVTGEKKRDALARMLSPNADVNVTPAAGVRPTNGTLTVLADTAASG